MELTRADLDATIAMSTGILPATAQRKLKVAMGERKESSKVNVTTVGKLVTKRQIVGRKKKMLTSVRRIGKIIITQPWQIQNSYYVMSMMKN